MSPAKSNKVKSIIDWSSYAILGTIGSAILLKMNTALDLLNTHTSQFAALETWARIVAHKIGIPL